MIYVVRYLLIVLYTIVWGCIGIPLLAVERSGRGAMWVARSWVAWILRTCGVTVETDGLENLTQPCVLMSNHQSVFDIVALVHTLPFDWKFVAKRELLWIPFFGWVLAAADQVVVDRSNHERAVASLQRAAERVRGGVNVIVFPEGTRSPDAHIAPFKSGGFHLALQAGVPIVPVSVSGSWRITPKKSLRVESGRLLIRYGEPIPTADLGVDDRNELKRRVREAIVAGFDRDLQGADRCG